MTENTGIRIQASAQQSECLPKKSDLGRDRRSRAGLWLELRVGQSESFLGGREVEE